MDRLTLDDVTARLQRAAVECYLIGWPQALRELGEWIECVLVAFDEGDEE